MTSPFCLSYPICKVVMAFFLYFGDNYKYLLLVASKFKRLTARLKIIRWALKTTRFHCDHAASVAMPLRIKKKNSKKNWIKVAHCIIALAAIDFIHRRIKFLIKSEFLVHKMFY